MALTSLKFKKNQVKFLYLETIVRFELLYDGLFMRFFETSFLPEAEYFISQFNPKTIKKILYNIDLAEQTNDVRLFKKLRQDIWEFRIKYGGLQIRLLAFWDKSEQKNTLVLATHGFIKKTDKTPLNEIERAEKLRIQYFENK